MKALATVLRFGSLKVGSTRSAPPGRRSFARLSGLGAILAIVALVQPPFTATPSSESIATYASDCATSQTTFVVGDTVCAVATDAPLGPPAQRLFEWVTPSGTIFKPIGPEITANPQSNSIIIPLNGPVGTWQVKTVDRSNNGHAVAKFVVQDPASTAVDLWCPISAPFKASPGSSAVFTVFVTNKGPNDAANVELTVTFPTNATFESKTQVTGPTFTCPNPAVGATESSCTIGTLPASTTAQFTFVFQVDSEAQPGAAVTSTATVTSSTNELFDTDNTFTATVTIAAQTCEVTCPPDIIELKDPALLCNGKIPDFATPIGVGAGCGIVVCSPAPGSVFPLGTTNVVCSGETGGTCTFRVTIQDSGTSISCPAAISRNESSPGLGFAVVNYTAPTFPDTCSVPAADCAPPSGSSFPIGATTVNCQTTNSSSSTLSCSFTVTINSLVCLLNCTDDVFATENPVGSNSAIATFALPTPSGCPNLTRTCAPPSGSSFPVGTTTVNCSNTLASCSFSVTVSPAAPCTLTCPANIIVDEDPNGTPHPDTGAKTVVNYPAPTTSNCSGVTVACIPSSGTKFGTGITVVTCVAADGSGNGVASCSFTVTVTSNNPCTITCPANVVAPNNPSQCGALVTYPAPTKSGDCGFEIDPETGEPVIDPQTHEPVPAVPHCSPPSGSFFPTGATSVICSIAGEVQCTFIVTVSQAGAPSSASVWVGVKNSDDVGTKFDLLAEVLKNGDVVAFGQLNNVPGGSSGFNNAVLDTINLALTGPASFTPGDMLSFRLSVRVAATSGHTSGTARLWFNDSAANSRVSAFIYCDTFLLDAFALGTSVGPGPKRTIDVLVNRNVGGNPFKPFGTWSRSF